MTFVMGVALPEAILQVYSPWGYYLQFLSIIIFMGMAILMLYTTIRLTRKVKRMERENVDQNDMVKSQARLVSERDDRPF